MIYKIIDLGVEQLNLAELYVKRKNAIKYILNKEVYLANYSLFGPTESRNLTYGIIRYAVKENLPILVNDCSIDAKVLQIEKQSYPKCLSRMYL